MEKFTEEQEALMFAHLHKVLDAHAAGRPRPPLPCWYKAILASSEKPEKPYYTAAAAREEREAPGDDLTFPEEWER